MEFIILLSIIIIALVLALNYDKDNKCRLTDRGEMTKSEIVIKNEHEYIVQEFTFGSYNTAHAEYFKIVNKIGGNDTIIESKYDLYDWSFNYLRYDNYTIGIKYYRSYNLIQIAKSDKPLKINTFEKDDPFFIVN